jgi:hypothetical protein
MLLNLMGRRGRYGVTWSGGVTSHVLVCLHSPLPVDHAVAAETLRDLRLDKGPNVGENFSHIAVLGRAAARVAAYTD